MGYAKNELINQQIADSPEQCPNCKWNYDDKYLIACPKHQREMSEADAERDYWESLLSTDFDLMTL